MHAMAVAAIGPATVPDAMITLALSTRLTVLAMPAVFAVFMNMKCMRLICIHVLNVQCA